MGVDTEIFILTSPFLKMFNMNTPEIPLTVKNEIPDNSILTKCVVSGLVR